MTLLQIIQVLTLAAFIINVCFLVKIRKANQKIQEINKGIQEDSKKMDELLRKCEEHREKQLGRMGNHD